MSVGPGVAKQLRGVLEDIPHVQHAFAYGSGVIVQPDLYDSHSTNKPMLDFIFAVDDPVDWHAQVSLLHLLAAIKMGFCLLQRLVIRLSCCDSMLMCTLVYCRTCSKTSITILCWEAWVLQR